MHEGEIMESGKCITFNLRALNAALASAILLGGVGFGIDAYAASATGGASATVVTAIAISQTTALNFGRFSAPTGGTAGTVTIDASAPGTRSFTGGTVLVTSGAGAIGNSGVFAVTGEASATYTITNPTATTLTGPGTAMGVTFTTSPSGIGGGTLSAGGAQTLFVGGTLSVGAVQTPGSYTGSYTVTVEYN
jgi:hypothetical protein